MSSPLISIIIPTFNAEHYIERCLNSIKSLECSQGDYEVIIIDNGSHDRTQEYIRALGFSFEIIPEVNVSALRNYGAKKALGLFLGFVDSDMELSPEWIKQALPVFTDPHVVGAGAPPNAPINSTWVQKAWEIHRCGQHDGALTQVAWLSSMNLIVRKKEFLAIGGFNEQLETAEDVDMCYRIGTHGVILRNPGMVSVHWGEAHNLKRFWQKEAWRGRGNLPGVLSHGLRLDELKSLAYPLYMLGVLLLLCCGLFYDVLTQHFFFVPISLFLLCTPPALLSCKTGFCSRHILAIPHLFMVYLIYGLARGWAVLQSLPSLVFFRKCEE